MRLSSAIFASFIAVIAFAPCSAQLSEVLMLTLSSNSTSDQTAVRFLAEASDSFDSQYDAYKMINPNPTPNIYTVSDEYYSINALNNDFSKKVVAVHVRAAFPAIYTITAEEIGAFDPSWSIQLTDLFLNQVIDLRKDTSYSFVANPTDSYKRFSLLFTKTEKYPQHPKDIDHMIYSDQDKIFVTTNSKDVSAISISDLEGNTLITSETASETWTFSPEKTGIYVVHLLTDQHTYTKKVMIYKN